MSRINELIEFEQSTLAVYEQLTVTNAQVNQNALAQIKSAHELSLNKLSNLLMFESRFEMKTEVSANSKGTRVNRTKLKARGCNLALVQANEREGLEKLESILLDASAPCKLKEIVRIDLLPKQKKHVHEIERLMAS